MPKHLPGLFSSHTTAAPVLCVLRTPATSWFPSLQRKRRGHSASPLASWAAREGGSEDTGLGAGVCIQILGASDSSCVTLDKLPNRPGPQVSQALTGRVVPARALYCYPKDQVWGFCIQHLAHTWVVVTAPETLQVNQERRGRGKK